MVEFVIVFPIQLTLTLLIMQFALLAHAHIVVQQAAFMGARAAAVSDGMVDDGAVPLLAAQRVAARTCMVLTSSADTGAGAPPSGGGLPTTLGWAGGPSLGAARTSQAYGHMNVNVAHSQHLVRCKIEFDYPLIIPVANSILARKVFTGEQLLFKHAGNYNDATAARGVYCYRIQRIGYIPTPWLEQGLTDETSVSLSASGNR
ncbi:MAG: pilus assembly protein [Planctomycetota bacterium]